MASKQNNKITNKQRVRLAAKIEKPHMKSIALGYLDLDEETIKNLEEENKNDVEAFNREVLKKWEYKNNGSNQVKVSKFVRSIFDLLLS